MVSVSDTHWGGEPRRRRRESRRERQEGRKSGRLFSSLSCLQTSTAPRALFLASGPFQARERSGRLQQSVGKFSVQGQRKARRASRGPGALSAPRFLLPLLPFPAVSNLKNILSGHLSGLGGEGIRTEVRCWENLPDTGIAPLTWIPTDAIHV